MTRASRRLLLRTVKWVFVPLALVMAGYLFVGPYVSEWANKSRVVDTAVRSEPN
ncbi:MAG: hypothetical protein M3R13_02030 [Armatimonadota bacterium]|nr:hypothetical protein [Armatimonadota bacterium]